MNRNGFITLLVVLVLTALVQSVVIVRDTEKAILLKLGAFERTLEPGLNFKIPFIDTVTKFEARIRSLDTPPDRVLSSEAKPLNVDSFVKYKIVDAETYYTSTNGGQSRVAEDTLQRRIKDKLRNEFGKRTLIEVVSGDRDGLMLALKNSLGEDSAQLGVEIIDFRVKRIDFEREIRASVFERMKTERNRIAEQLRAEGRETAEKIRADADKQRTIILASASFVALAKIIVLCLSASALIFSAVSLPSALNCSAILFLSVFILSKTEALISLSKSILFTRKSIISTPS